MQICPALSGCSAEAVPGGDSGGGLRYSMVLPPVTLGPVETTDAWSAKAVKLAFQGLYEYDQRMDRVPVLASGSSTVSDGGTTYTVSLADGATFADGSDVTAADVKYTFEAAREAESPNAWQAKCLDSMATPDDRTVRFRLSHPYPAFGDALTRPVVPKSVREGNEATFGRRPDTTAGSGPYDPTVFKPGEYVRLKRRGDVWGERSPRVERVRLVTTRAGLARTMALKTGQSDVTERIQPKLWDATREIPSVSIVRRPGFNSYFVAFNCGADPTSEEDATNGTFYREESVTWRLRRARRATDRETRRTLYEEAVTTLLEDRAILPAFTLDNSFGVKRRVRGFEPHPLAQCNPSLVGVGGGPVRIRE